MSADIVKLSGAAFCLTPAIGEFLVRPNAELRFALSPQGPSAVVRSSSFRRPSRSEAVG